MSLLDKPRDGFLLNLKEHPITLLNPPEAKVKASVMEAKEKSFLIHAT